jgi:hypothetical protein
MPFHLAAFFQSVDPAGNFVALNGVTDPVLTVVGANVQVPTLNKIIAAAAGVETAAAQQARITAPSRRVLALQRVAPTQGNAAAASLPADPHHVSDWRATPLQMVTGEQVNFEIASDPVAAQAQWGLVWFADALAAPGTGPYFTVRATGATVLTVGQWTNVPLTLSENLPRGRYQLVGLRAQAAGLVAARAVFVGTGAQGAWRPGVMGTNNDRHLEHPMFRTGGLGVFGEFEDTDLFSIDCLSTSADAAEVFYLDLVQVRAGPA